MCTEELKNWSLEINGKPLGAFLCLVLPSLALPCLFFVYMISALRELIFKYFITVRLAEEVP